MSILTSFGRGPGGSVQRKGADMTPLPVSARNLDRWTAILSLIEPSEDPMIQIKTRQLRRVHSPRVGDMLIEHTYIDRPASIDTWVEHCAALAAEFGISALEAHNALFEQLPEIFGR